MKSRIVVGLVVGCLAAAAMVGCAAEPPEGVETAPPDAPKTTYQVEHEVVDGQNALVARDADHREVARMVIDITSTSSRTLLTTKIDGAPAQLDARVDKASSTMTITATTPRGNATVSHVMTNASEKPEASFVALVEPFQQYNNVFSAALQDPKVAAYFNGSEAFNQKVSSEVAADAPGSAQKTQYGACAWITGTISTAACAFTTAGWGAVACGLVGVFVSDWFCDQNTTNELECITFRGGCGNGVWQTCCQTYYGCQTSHLYGGCY